MGQSAALGLLLGLALGLALGLPLCSHGRVSNNTVALPAMSTMIDTMTAVSASVFLCFCFCALETKLGDGRPRLSFTDNIKYTTDH